MHQEFPHWKGNANRDRTPRWKKDVSVRLKKVQNTSFCSHQLIIKF